MRRATNRLMQRSGAVVAGLGAGSYSLAPTSNCGQAFGYVVAGGSTAANAWGAARIGATFGDAIGDKSASVSTTSVSVGSYVATNDVDGGFDSQVWEAFLEFNTLLQPGRSVSSATLSLFITTDNSATNFTINVRPSAFGTSVDILDFVSGGSLSASPIASLPTSLVSSGNSFTLGTDIATNVTSTGFTRLMLYSNRTQTNTVPTTGVNEYVIINPSSCRLNLTVA